MTDLKALTEAELLALSRSALRELRERGVVRTWNAPAGDYAEVLVRRATDGELAPNSQKSWDVLTPAGEYLQVKARIVTSPNRKGDRQLSPFRSWDFDAAILVLFDDDFRVWRAGHVPVATLREVARANQYVNAFTVFATDALLGRPEVEDWTDRLRHFA